ncbi:unnamed protein product, partial [marine sediment metagenome]
KKETTEQAGGTSVYSYKMYDPDLENWYSAISVGDNTVTMSDQGRRQWEIDRGMWRKQQRFMGYAGQGGCN